MCVVLYMNIIHFSYHDYDLRDKFENSIKLNNGIFPWYYHQVHFTLGYIYTIPSFTIKSGRNFQFLVIDNEFLPSTTHVFTR